MNTGSPEPFPDQNPSVQPVPASDDRWEIAEAAVSRAKANIDPTTLPDVIDGSKAVQEVVKVGRTALALENFRARRAALHYIDGPNLPAKNPNYIPRHSKDEIVPDSLAGIYSAAEIAAARQTVLNSRKYRDQ
jgi:hypothetical protein